MVTIQVLINVYRDSQSGGDLRSYLREVGLLGLVST